MNVTCPICHAVIPVVESDRPNSEGLSTGMDDRLVQEHIEMHRECTCLWNTGHLIKIDPVCTVHSEPAPASDEPDDVFTDVEVTE